MEIRFLGIRHHGPGSCRNVVHALHHFHPDLILLEGPPEAEPLLSYIADQAMKPPVALLAYCPDDPQTAVFYPFAEFSPEWQTLRYATEQHIPIRFFDLPLIYALAVDKTKQHEEKVAETDEREQHNVDEAINTHDPFDHYARIAGYDDGEQWWDVEIESRRNATGIFEAVEEAITALREHLPERKERNLLREAWMRKMIRTAEKEGHEKIAVVCGAWHVPALVTMPKVKEDNERLKGLSKIKVDCTWIPWTYDRLSLYSGYGAGITSPGWYEHLWFNPADDGTLWVSHIAALLRKNGMDISVAHVIETVRLANATAALRNEAHPSLSDFNDAVTTVMGFGDDTLLRLIRHELTVGSRMGEVPDHVPKVPLVLDVERQIKKFRIHANTEVKKITLDLRESNDLAKSIFFHRLALLGIDMITPEESSGKGTFKENWSSYYKPEHILTVIERAIWGNTLAEATVKYVHHRAGQVNGIAELTEMLEKVIPADLPDLVTAMTEQLDALSAVTTDIMQMMKAVPGLVHIVHYGNVRRLDYSSVEKMLHALLARIMAGGVLLCMHIDEEAAGEIWEQLSSVDYALATANDEELTMMWIETVRKINSSVHTHPLLSGYTARLLRDRELLSADDMQRVLRYYASVGNTPSDMAFWFEGFLKSSGTVLLIDEDFWKLINTWMASLHADDFMTLLPILRRTCGDFTPAERRKIGEKAQYGTDKNTDGMSDDVNFNPMEAEKVIPLIWKLIGIKNDE